MGYKSSAELGQGRENDMFRDLQLTLKAIQMHE